MKFQLKNPFIAILLSLMTGIFVAISFLETPMKFQVSGMMLPIALELGKLMFGISTDLQIAFLALIIVIALVNRKNLSKYDFTAISILFVIVLVQKFWMLPVLDARADLLSAGKPVPSSEMHSCFIYAEAIKALFLLTAIVLQFKNKIH